MLQLNTANLYQVMRDFHILTNIRIVIFDTSFKEVLAYPPKKEGFCALIRQNPSEEADCFASDKNGCLQCSKQKKLVVYHCHAGLTEAVVPIFDKSSVLAYVMFGQIIPKTSCQETKAAILKSYPSLFAEIEKIPVKSAEEIDAAATVLQAITAYMMTNRWVAPSKSEFIREIDRYIDEHLAEKITAEDICTYFRIGRTKLYGISMDYLGCGLAEYVRKQKIAYAQQLLINTNLTVTEIAYAVGFSDYNHFSRVFKQVTGASARIYRKNHKSRPTAL